MTEYKIQWCLKNKVDKNEHVKKERENVQIKNKNIEKELFLG